jgi:hypothetical protein
MNVIALEMNLNNRNIISKRREKKIRQRTMKNIFKKIYSSGISRF